MKDFGLKVSKWSRSRKNIHRLPLSVNTGYPGMHHCVYFLKNTRTVESLLCQR